MKAATSKRYGSAEVLEIKELDRPEIRDNEVLVKVYKASVTTADWRLRASAFPIWTWLPGRLMFGLFSPRNKVLGSDFSGRIVAKGIAVTRFKGGDKVFGSAGKGAHAEFVKIAEDGAIELKPAGLDYAEAAALPFGALASLVFLRDFAKVKPEQQVLINGASGGLGVYAVQIAKHFGANVTGVCSTCNLELVKSLGADHVIDYTSEDLSRSGITYDLIFDPVGKTSFRGCKPLLKPNGVYLPVEFEMREIIQSLISSIIGGKKVVVGISGDSLEDLTFIKGLVESGKIKPVIDSQYPLEQIADAHRRVESRHKVGSVIVAPTDDVSFSMAS